MTSSPYEDSFHKLTAVSDLPIGTPRVFRAAGATVIIRRTPDNITAIDGSSQPSDGELASDWDTLHEKAGLAVRVEDNDVWVCLEACQP